MADAEDTSVGASAAGSAEFTATHWSVVLAAGQQGSPQAVEALETLCRTYWHPLYVYVRRRGYGPEDAQDLTQQFFAQFLEKEGFSRADPDRGKFRSFLLKSVQHFLADAWKRVHRAKRGGGARTLPWDSQAAEECCRAELAEAMTPERAYERRWAMTLLEKATEALRREHEAVGERAVFDALLGFLSGTQDQEPYKEVAARLNLTEDAVRVRVHRLKRRFGKLLREVIADTVEAGEIDEEMRHLFTVFD